MEFHPRLFEGNRTLDDKEIALFQKDRWTSTDIVDKIEYIKKVNLNMIDEDKSKESEYKLNRHEETLLTNLYFSKNNIQNIQNLIKFIVHRETKYIIDNQSETELIIVMRSVYLEYVNHPNIITQNMNKSEKEILYKLYTKEIARLNEIVINLIVPKIISQVQQYLDYLRDSNVNYQIELPKSNSITGEREYRSPTQVFFGGDF